MIAVPRSLATLVVALTLAAGCTPALAEATPRDITAVATADVGAGIAAALKQFAARGWEVDVGFIRPDETAGPTVEHLLASTSYDCVVIGAGVRLLPRRVAVFEAVINAVHKAAPGAAIAFNTTPEDSADAAARWLPPGHRRVQVADEDRAARARRAALVLGVPAALLRPWVNGIGQTMERNGEPLPPYGQPLHSVDHDEVTWTES